MRVNALLAALLPGIALAAEPRQVAGIYPHLAYYNEEGECGTGAVVPWADRLWVITYAPHQPKGSSDKLYEITADLQVTVRPESIGGTPANRMIHRESQQLFIGPYAIGADRAVRAIPYARMYGRHTGLARHLADPAHKIVFATMEEGIYEVDVASLEAKELWTDEQVKAGRHAGLPGYHGKGFYSAQGRYVYANNGDHAAEARVRPDVPSGVLAEWDGQAGQWTVVRRNQFTEVTGPGGIEGNPPGDDRLWSIGWDHRSLILMALDAQGWHAYRLPKASHCYDGAHGWNTEWPRIRDVGPAGQPELMMTMHGMFWRFPRTFAAANSAGLRPRSSYLKVVGDFCRWGDRLVLGCDDSAKSEFLNKRKVKGALAGPGQSNSNLWFIDPATPDQLGPTTAGGAVWLRDPVKAGEVSEPFLFAGWARRGVHLVNGGPAPVAFAFEVDEKGRGEWSKLRTVEVPAGAARWVEFATAERGEWVRLRAGAASPAVSAHFVFSNPEARGTEPAPEFAGLSRIGEGESLGGLVHARGENRRTLLLGAQRVGAAGVTDGGAYELTAGLELRALDDTGAVARLQGIAAIPRDAVAVEDASVLVVDGRGRRWRLPRGAAAFDAPTRAGRLRICREVATERDVFSCHGTFYELPAENADGFARIRPISSHDLQIMDYGSYRGLLVMTGLRPDAQGPRIVRSADGQAALWVGALDELWKLGKPRGQGGPWKGAEVKAGVASDPYLLAGYDRRRLELRNEGDQPLAFRVEVDPTGDGLWVDYQRFEVAGGQSATHEFPGAFQARWLRVTPERDGRATAWLTYD